VHASVAHVIASLDAPANIRAGSTARAARPCQLSQSPRSYASTASSRRRAELSSPRRLPARSHPAAAARRRSPWAHRRSRRGSSTCPAGNPLPLGVWATVHATAARRSWPDDRIQQQLRVRAVRERGHGPERHPAADRVDAKQHEGLADRAHLSPQPERR
jgi:hypothetical protein